MAQQKSYHLSLTRMRESVGRDRMLRLVPCIQLPSVAIGVRRSVHAKSAAKSSVKTMKANRKQAARPKLWRCFWDCDGNIWHVFCSFTDNKVRFLHRSAVTHPDVTVSLQQGRSKLSDQGVTRASLRCVVVLQRQRRMRMSPDTNSMCWALKLRQADKNEESAEAPRSQLAVHHRSTQHPLTRSIKHRAEQRAANEQETTCSQSQSRFVLWF